MIFHENSLLADDSHKVSNFIYFFLKLGKMSQNLLSAAVVIGALRAKGTLAKYNAYLKSYITCHFG